MQATSHCFRLLPEILPHMDWQPHVQGTGARGAQWVSRSWGA